MIHRPIEVAGHLVCDIFEATALRVTIPAAHGVGDPSPLGLVRRAERLKAQELAAAFSRDRPSGEVAATMRLRFSFSCIGLESRA